MIKKPFDINNLDQSLNFFLFYGKNEGAKKEEVSRLISNNKSRTI